MPSKHKLKKPSQITWRLSLFLILSIGLIGYAFQSGRLKQASQYLPWSQKTAKTTNLATVRRGDFSRTLQLVAQVEAQRQLYLAAPFNAKLAMIAEEGKAVKAQDVIARLETKDIEDRLEEHKLELESDISTLEEHDRNQQAETIRLDAQIQTAQNAVNLAQLELKTLTAGTPPEELKKLQLQYTLTENALNRSQSDLTLKEKLATRGMSSRLEVLQGQLQVAQREEAFKVASARYEIAKKGATPLARRIARTALEQAQDNLQWAQQEKRLTLKSAQFEREKKRLKRDASQAEVKQRATQLKAAVLKAPLAGTVVLNKSFTQEGLKQVSVGDDVFEGNPFVSVADLEKVNLRGEADEIVLRYLKPGMIAEVKIPSLKGQHFQAKLKQIGILAHERSGRQNTAGLSRVFDVSFEPQQHDVFAPGATVDISLPFQSEKNVLLLPRTAVQRSTTGHYVIRLNGEKQPVKLGYTNTEEVIIIEGLNEGEQVQLPLKEEVSP